MIETEQEIKTPSEKRRASNKFASDVIWVGLAQLFNSLILGFVTMPWLTKAYTPEIYGIWVTLNITVALLSPCLALQLGTSVVRFLSREEDKIIRRKALGSMLLSIISVSIVVAIIANIIAPELSSFLFANRNYTIYIRLTCLWIFVNALFNFFILYFYARNKIKLLAIRQVIVSLVTMVLIIILAIKGCDIIWVITSAIAVQAVFTLAFLIMVIKEVGWPLPNITGLKTYLAFSTPQVPGGVLLWIIQYSDRYFITYFLGLSYTGIYSSSYTLASLTSLFYAPLSIVLLPQLSRLWEEKRFSDVKSYLDYSSRLFIAMAIPAAAGIAILSQPLLKLLTTEEFLAGTRLVLFVAFGIFFLGMYKINVNIILLLKRTKAIPVIIGSASVVNILINILLVPRMGILGSSIATLISYFILSVVVSIWARKAVNYNLDFKFMAKVVGATSIMAVCLYFLRLQGTLGIIITIVTGSAIFVGGLLLFRALSENEMRVIKGMLAGFIPGLQKRDNK